MRETKVRSTTRSAGGSSYGKSRPSTRGAKIAQKKRVLSGYIEEEDTATAIAPTPIPAPVASTALALAGVSLLTSTPTPKSVGPVTGKSIHGGPGGPGFDPDPPGDDDDDDDEEEDDAPPPPNNPGTSIGNPNNPITPGTDSGRQNTGFRGGSGDNPRVRDVNTGQFEIDRTNPDATIVNLRPGLYTEREQNRLQQFLGGRGFNARTYEVPAVPEAQRALEPNNTNLGLGSAEEARDPSPQGPRASGPGPGQRVRPGDANVHPGSIGPGPGQHNAPGSYVQPGRTPHTGSVGPGPGQGNNPGSNVGGYEGSLDNLVGGPGSQGPGGGTGGDSYTPTTIAELQQITNISTQQIQRYIDRGFSNISDLYTQIIEDDFTGKFGKKKLGLLWDHYRKKPWLLELEKKKSKKKTKKSKKSKKKKDSKGKKNLKGKLGRKQKLSLLAMKRKRKSSKG